MVRCSDGHFYDPAKHPSCPWCAKPLEIGAQPGPDPVAGKTRPVGAVVEAAELPPPSAAVPGAASNAGATKRLAPKELGIDPVVGWLVCVDGPGKGKDYRIHTERNFIGRAATMDISIAGDDTISRERHAIVTFDPKKKQFWIQPGESTGLVYLNEEAIYVPQQLKERDVIEVGQTKLVFVPFVNESFQWQ
ncbi:MAG: FHA domain-containing protein [Acidobacteria bacterium]|nr:FHA domain-containing protein [Acidobacteriota bacterium]